MNNKKYYSIQNASKFIGISRQMIYRYINEGYIKTIQLDEKQYIEKDELKRFTNLPRKQGRKFKGDDV